MSIGEQQEIMEEAARASSKFNRNAFEHLHKHAQSEPHNAWLRDELQKVQQYIGACGEGAVNKRRSILKSDIEKKLNGIKFEYHQRRRAYGKQLIDDALDTISKKDHKSSSERLADLMETQTRIAAMTNDELVALADRAKSENKRELCTAFRSETEANAAIVELRRRGESERADVTRQMIQKVPAAAIGDEDAGRKLAYADDLWRTEDTDAAYLHDEQGRRYGVDMDALVDTSPLENVPE